MPGTGPCLLIDFDGTLCEFRRWHSADTIEGAPTPGAMEALRNYLDADFKVCVYSARSKEPGAIEAMQGWLRLYGMTDDEMHRISFPTQKPSAFLTIDDRAWCFTGEWPSVQDIYEFRPWYRRNPAPPAGQQYDMGG